MSEFPAEESKRREERGDGSYIDEEQRSTTEERVVTPITQWPTAADEFDIKTMMALYKYANARCSSPLRLR